MNARRPLSSFLEAILALHFYGAAGITAFGWAVGKLSGWASAPYTGLWFCAALLVYNADRLKHDPADHVNIPRRAAASIRWRRASRWVLAGAAVFLLGWPVVRHDWITLALVVAGGAICLGYSFPLFGRRLKELPLLKTFFAPTIVTAAVIALPWLHDQRALSGVALIGVVFCAWSFLFFNMLLCDLRDLEGDRDTGVVSLPVMLGANGTRQLLAALLVIIEALAIAILVQSLGDSSRTWLLLCVLVPLYLGALWWAVRRPQSESFYEWWVEGMLFLPAVAVLLTSA